MSEAKKNGTKNSRAKSSRPKQNNRKKKGKNRDVLITVLLVVLVLLTAAVLLLVTNAGRGVSSGKSALDSLHVQEDGASGEDETMENEETDDGRPPLDVQLLTPNEFSRPQIATDEINGIVIHYTANPGTTAQRNRDYFETLKDTGETHASSHFIVGLEGEIIQCIPSTEISYASNTRNKDTLSIECCHPDETGKFTDETYDALVELTAWLCRHFSVPAENVIRHYDITGKLCPLYFVEHEDAWQQFLNDVQNAIDSWQSK